MHQHGSTLAAHEPVGWHWALRLLVGYTVFRHAQDGRVSKGEGEVHGSVRCLSQLARARGSAHTHHVLARLSLASSRRCVVTSTDSRDNGSEGETCTSRPALPCRAPPRTCGGPPESPPPAIKCLRETHALPERCTSSVRQQASNHVRKGAADRMNLRGAGGQES